MRWTAVVALLGAAGPALAQPVEPSASPAPDRGGFLLDVRVGFGAPIAYPTQTMSWLVPVTLGVGWRFRGGYTLAAVLEPASGDVAELEYAVDSSQPLPTGCADASCGFHLVLGVEGTRTFEQSRWRPWVGVLAGLETLDADRAGGSGTESWYGWVVRASAGVPLVKVSTFRFDAYASAELGGWTDRELEVGGTTTTLAVGQAMHGAVTAGLRIAWMP